MQQRLGLVLAPLLLVCCAQASTVILHDASSSHLIGSPEEGTNTLSQGALLAALSSIGGLTPPYKLQDAEASKVQALVESKLFKRPKALVLLQLAGMEADEVTVSQLRAALGDGISRHIQVDGSGSGAAALVQGVGDLAAANADVPVRLLDHMALKGCDAACMEQHLSAAAAAIGGSYEAGPSSDGPLSGMLLLPGGTGLSLREQAHRLLAIELAGLQGALTAHLALLQPQEDIHVYEATLVSAQALRAAGSSGAAAAGQALLAMVAKVKERLQEAYGSSVVYQVALLGDAPVASGDPTHLLDWKETARRSLLLSEAGQALWPFGARQEPRDPRGFSTKAAAYGAFLLLLYATAGALYCMVTMKFKADSLLYGRSKAD